MSDERQITIEQIRQWAHAQDHAWDAPLLVAALMRHEAWRSGGVWCMDDAAWTYFLGVVDAAAVARWQGLIKNGGLDHLALLGQEYDHRAQALLMPITACTHGCAMDLVLRVDDALPGLRLERADIIDQVSAIITSNVRAAILARAIRTESAKPRMTLEYKL